MALSRFSKKLVAILFIFSPAAMTLGKYSETNNQEVATREPEPFLQTSTPTSILMNLQQLYDNDANTALFALLDMANQKKKEEYDTPELERAFEQLLLNGGNPNAVNANGLSLLAHATQHKLKNFIIILLNFKVDMHQEIKLSALSRAIQNKARRYLTESGTSLTEDFFSKAHITPVSLAYIVLKDDIIYSFIQHGYTDKGKKSSKGPVIDLSISKNTDKPQEVNSSESSPLPALLITGIIAIAGFFGRRNNKPQNIHKKATLLPNVAIKRVKVSPANR